MKRLIATGASLAVAAIASLSMTSAATASGEVASVGLDMTSQTGKLYTQQKQPVNWRTEVKITAAFPANPTVLPMKQVTVTFPNDMAFVPSNDTPVCPDSAVGPAQNLSFPPEVIIGRCPTSVIGNGTAQLYLSQANSAAGPNLKDPVLIVFNGGKNAQGQAVLKIYGYSASTGAGIYMEGALVDGKLNIKIPYLTFDSAVGEFNLNIPGTNAPDPARRGVDKTYVQATCSTGTWLTDASFQLGTRSSDGADISPTSTVVAPQDSTPCTDDGPGTVGGKFAKPKVKGPGKAKQGKKATFKVTVKNTGAGTIKGAKVTAKGKGAKGSAKVGNLAKGKSKTVKVKVKFSKKGKIKTKFKATGKGASAKTAVKTVKVK